MRRRQILEAMEGAFFITWLGERLATTGASAHSTDEESTESESESDGLTDSDDIIQLDVIVK